jgi:hypothetical protein
MLVWTEKRLLYQRILAFDARPQRPAIFGDTPLPVCDSPQLDWIMAASVVVPLYVYPSVGAWDPVYDM